MAKNPHKKKCPDCHQCQLCSETRCRACRRERSIDSPSPTLARFFTHGDYLAWKKNRRMENTEGCQ